MLDLSKMSILVTGGFGFIGSHIVEGLLKKGVKFVRIFDNGTTDAINKNLKFLKNYNNYDILRGDIIDYHKCLQSMKGIDAICHHAALVSVPLSLENPILTNQNNVIGFVNLLNAARTKGVKRFIYASTSAVYGDDDNNFKKEYIIGNQLSPYGLSKLIGEKYAKLYTDVYNIKCIGLRYFNVYGPRQNIDGPYASVIPKFINKILNNEHPGINGDGNNTRDFIYVDDIVSANINCLTIEYIKFGGIFNIGTGKQISVNEIYDKISKILNYTDGSYFYPHREGDILHSCADISKANNILGFTSSITLDEGLKKTIEYYKKLINK